MLRTCYFSLFLQEENLSVVLKESLIPGIGPQGHWALTTSDLEWTGTALPLKCQRERAGCRAGGCRSQRCVWHSASFTGWTAGVISGHLRDARFGDCRRVTKSCFPLLLAHTCTQSHATLHPSSLPKLLMLKDIFYSCPKQSHL